MSTTIYDENVRGRLAEFITANGLTHADMAKKLRLSSTTRLTKYLNLHKPGATAETDAVKVEAAARNFLRHAARRDQMKLSLFENPVSRQVAAIIEQIKKTCDIGLIYSAAGVGKTSGAELYCNDHPEAVLITAMQYRRLCRDIEQMLFNALIDPSAPDLGGRGNGYVKRSVWMEEKLRGSDRVIILDNAHKVDPTVLGWLCDFNDATSCPVVLIGNPSVLRMVRDNDQVYTRIGLVKMVSNKGEQHAAAEHLIQQFAPASNGALVEIVADQISSLGQMRTVRKQLLLATDLFASGKCDGDWEKAYETAATLLVKPAIRKA